MLIRRRAARMAAAVVAMVIVAACTDSSGGTGRQAAGSGSTRPATSSPPTPSPTPSPSTSAPSTAASSSAVPTTAAPVTSTTVRTPSTPIPPVASKEVPTGNDILGPTGWQTLQLGMAPGVAAATGMFPSTPAPAGGGCASWFAVGAAAIDSATISPNLGVIAITIASSDKVLMTPEGMALGWTVAQVHAAYPSFPLDAESRPAGPPTIPVPQNSQAVYRVRLSAGVVVTMTLESFPQDCYS